jgi:hypothetical protein
MRVQVRRIPLHELGNPEEAARAVAQAHRAKFQPGLGDLVAAATSSVGIKPCGKCLKRKAAMNARTPTSIRRLLGWALKYLRPHAR